MKSKIILIAWIITMFTLEARAMTLEQLCKGAAQTAVYDPNEANAPEPPINSLLFVGYYWGFFDSIENSPDLIHPDTEQVLNLRIYRAAEWMNDLKKVASSISAFVLKRSPDGFDQSKVWSGNVMMAWYLANCRDADYYSNFAVCELLEKTFGKGYPGSAEDFKVMQISMAKKLKDNIKLPVAPEPPAPKDKKAPAPTKKEKK